jgi:hypothetical protein
MTTEDREDIKRHVDVVAEGLRSDNQMLAEAIAMNTNWLGRLERRLEGHDVRLDGVEGELHALRDEVRQGFGELRSHRAGRGQAGLLADPSLAIPSTIAALPLSSTAATCTTASRCRRALGIRPRLSIWTQSASVRMTSGLCVQGIGGAVGSVDETPLARDRMRWRAWLESRASHVGAATPRKITSLPMRSTKRLPSTRTTLPLTAVACDSAGAPPTASVLAERGSATIRRAILPSFGFASDEILHSQGIGLVSPAPGTHGVERPTAG